MILSGRTKLQGIVEVDEVFVVGKVPGKRGRGAEGKSRVKYKSWGVLGKLSYFADIPVRIN